MEAIRTFDEDFKLDDKRKYFLAIQAGCKSLTYIILDIEEKKYIGLKHFDFKSLPESEINKCIKKTIEEDPLLTHNFHETIFQYQSFRAMLVPESLFDSKNLRAFLRFHYDVDEKDHIHFQELKSSEAYLIFTVPVFIEELMTNRFPQIKFSHHTVPFIHNAVKDKGLNETGPSLHIYFTCDFFDVLIVRNNKVQLFNSFFYKKYTDVVFFIANILNLFSLKPGNTKIYFSGQIDEISEEKKELEKMFKTIIFEKYNPDFNYSIKLTSLAQHRFANILNLYNCDL